MQTNQLRADFSAIFRRTSSAPSVWRRISQYRDAGTYADEWLILFKILLPISAGFTLAFGAVLHYHILTPYIGSYLAVGVAFIFTAFIELAKLLAGKWIIRGMFFGIWKHGIAALTVLIAGTAIAVGAFWWSYYNSTKGVQYITQHVGQAVVERPVVEGKTSDVDARLAATEKARKEALSIKWKGTTTVSGQRIAEKATAAQLEQERQRTILLQQQATEQANLDQHRNTFITRVADILALLGGKMEWFQLFILFGMVACERSLWDRMNQNQVTGAPSPTPQHVRPPAFEERTHFFNRHKDTGTVLPKEPFTAPAPPGIHGLPVYERDTDEAQEPPLIDFDSSMRHFRTGILREIANLKAGNGSPKTVCGRMRDHLDRSARLINMKGFSAKPDTVLAFVQTTYEALAEMREAKYPYEFESGFKADLERLSERAEAAA